jgi:hypothetical protein
MHETTNYKRFYGVYRAIVIDNKDPLDKKRLKLQIPQIFLTEITGWSWPGSSVFFIPVIGSTVWAMFEGGDPSFPVWLTTSNSIDGGTP